MQDAGPARTLFTSPRWDCRCWALTSLKRRWRSHEKRPAHVELRLNSLLLTRSSWSVWGANSTQCWTVDCFTPSTPTSDHDTGRVSGQRWNTTGPFMSYASVTLVPILARTQSSQEELRAAFNPNNGWNVAAIKPDRLQTRFHANAAPPWF